MRILRNFTWWVDGSSLHLELDELTPPSIADKLEELRVGLYAQELRTPMPVSVKRLQKIWERRPR